MKKVCLLAFVLFTWSIVVNAQESDGRYVEVTGSSEIEVVPDEIHFLVQIKEYWQEEYTGKSKKEEDFHTKVIGRRRAAAPNTAAQVILIPILRRSRANSTIKMAFLANRPINMMRAICI